MTQQRKTVPIQTATLYALLVMLIVSIVSAPQGSISAVTGALTLCVKTIIPSLFPFFVCCNILVRTGFVNVVGRFLTPVMKPLFNVSGTGAFAFFMGVISGYPVGAKMVTELYETGQITRTEARRLLPFCNNSGPLFILGALGVTLLGNQGLGILLYGIHVLSALLVGVLFRFYHHREHAEPGLLQKQTVPDYSLGEVFTKSISDSILSVLNICGFIVFFAAILACLENAAQIISIFILPLTNADGSLISAVVKGVFEMTNGVSAVCASGAPLAARLTALSFLLGFGGISVHMQVLGIVSPTGIGMSTYLCGKTMQGLIAAGLTVLACKFFPSVPAMAVPPPSVYFTPHPFQVIAFILAVNLFFITVLSIFYFISERRRKHREKIEREKNRKLRTACQSNKYL